VLIADPAMAGAAAVALAIALMFALRCLHPPGGATALLAAMGAVRFDFALFPMLVNSLLLVSAGVLFNTLTGRRYPHGSVRAPATTSPTARFSDANMDAALAHYQQVLDVSRDDLSELLHLAEAASFERNFGQLRCADIMSREPLVVPFGLGLDAAWAPLRQHRIRAFPVIGRARRIVGIVTVADFLHHPGFDRPEGIGP